MRVLFLDTETTGLDNGRLIQLAYKERTMPEVFVEYYKPPVAIEIGAMATHHITEKMVADKVPFAESKTYQSLPALFAEAVVIAHNAKFDLEILRNEGLTVGSSVCTLKVAQTLYDCEKYNLQFLRYLWGIDIDGVIAHDAKGDVLVLEAVFERMLKDYQTLNGVSEIEALERFIDISTKPLLLKKISFGKYAGKSFEEIRNLEPGYLEWLAQLPDKDEDFKYTVSHYLSRVTS